MHALVGASGFSISVAERLNYVGESLRDSQNSRATPHPGLSLLTNQQRQQLAEFLFELFGVAAPADEVDRQLGDVLFMLVLPVAAKHVAVEIEREEQPRVSTG